MISGTLIVNGEKFVSLREKFIAYCELQRNARNYREMKGADHKDTKLAYEKANEKKREVLDMIDELEYRIESLEK